MSLCGHLFPYHSTKELSLPLVISLLAVSRALTSTTRRYSAVNTGFLRLLHPEMRLTIADHLFEVSLRARVAAALFLTSFSARPPTIFYPFGIRSLGRGTSNKKERFFAQFLGTVSKSPRIIWVSPRTWEPLSHSPVSPRLCPRLCFYFRPLRHSRLD